MTNASPRVTVCRGCCCGSGRRHPDVDHAALLTRIGSGGVPVRTTDCLGPCAEQDVVVVSPTPGARRAGARPVWLGAVLDARSADAVSGWVRAGGPGIADMPHLLRDKVFDPR